MWTVIKFTGASVTVGDNDERKNPVRNARIKVAL